MSKNRLKRIEQFESRLLMAVDAVRFASIASEISDTATTDIELDFDGRYTGSQLQLVLEEGRIFQHNFGSSLPPNDLLFSVEPQLEFDTFVAVGSSVAGSSQPFLGGGAINLGGEPTPQFDEVAINLSWFVQPGTVVADQTDFLSARITLSSDARGTFSYLASVDGQTTTITGTILNGRLFDDSQPQVRGDFTLDGVVNADDIDALFAAIQDPPTNEAIYDLNEDEQLDQADIYVLLNEILDASPGDANLDGTVNFSDFLILSQNFGTSAGWASGDFNGNGQIDFTDFLLLAARIDS